MDKVLLYLDKLNNEKLLHQYDLKKILSNEGLRYEEFEKKISKILLKIDKIDRILGQLNNYIEIKNELYE